MIPMEALWQVDRSQQEILQPCHYDLDQEVPLMIERPVPSVDLLTCIHVNKQVNNGLLEEDMVKILKFMEHVSVLLATSVK